MWGEVLGRVLGCGVRYEKKCGGRYGGVGEGVGIK